MELAVAYIEVAHTEVVRIEVVRTEADRIDADHMEAVEACTVAEDTEVDHIVDRIEAVEVVGAVS